MARFPARSETKAISVAETPGVPVNASTTASASQPAAYRRGPVIALEGTGQWRTAVVDLPDALLDNRQHSGADLRIAGMFDFVVGSVMLLRGPDPAASETAAPASP